ALSRIAFQLLCELPVRDDIVHLARNNADLSAVADQFFDRAAGLRVLANRLRCFDSRANAGAARHEPIHLTLPYCFAYRCAAHIELGADLELCGQKTPQRIPSSLDFLSQALCEQLIARPASVTAHHVSLLHCGDHPPATDMYG